MNDHVRESETNTTTESDKKASEHEGTQPKTKRTPEKQAQSAKKAGRLKKPVRVTALTVHRA